MNNEEATFLLHGYRPDGSDAQDPQFAEALDQVKRDPALKRWFQQQQAFDGTIAEKLRCLPIPNDLKANILAGRKLIRPQAWWLRHPIATALAACLVLALGLSALWQRGGAGDALASYREDMVQLVRQVEAEEVDLEYLTADLAEIRQWIGEHSSHGDAIIPDSLAPGSGLGCRVLSWRDHAVVLACFKSVDGPPVHLLVIDSQAFGDAPAAGSRLAYMLHDMNTTAWSAEGKTYLLVSRAPAETLERLL